MKRILVGTLSVLVAATSIYAEEIRGRVLTLGNQPVAEAIVSAPMSPSVVTDENGYFTLEIKDGVSTFNVWATGYYSVDQLVNGRKEVTVLLVSEKRSRYNEELILPQREDNRQSHLEAVAAQNVAKKDFSLTSNRIDGTLNGRFAGLFQRRMSGMPGEGSYLNLRGIRSMTADNAPLIVVNGIPYMPDKAMSQVTEGYARDLFQAFHIQNIQNITVLKGVEASLYGSLGSNGVILIETDGATSNDMETQVSYYGQVGMGWAAKNYPILSGAAYNDYLTDLGRTAFPDQGTMFGHFPFLNDPADKVYGDYYNNQTDWQDEIYDRTLSHSHLLRVEGGDNIAKYDLSLGYSDEEGILRNTGQQRFNLGLNGNILVSKTVNISASIDMAYLAGDYQIQGMNISYNPMLAALAKAPVLSPFNKDRDGNLISSYSPYYYGHNTSTTFAVSNPLAIVNTLETANQQLEVNMKAAVNYKPTPYWSFSGIGGLFYNYNSEKLFVPGSTEMTIIPVTDAYGTARNLSRSGVAETLNMFYGVNARYNRVFDDVHSLDALAGVQGLITRKEYDAGEGRNTPNDFYRTLNYTNEVGRHFFGYLDTWNWLNLYAHAGYTYARQWQGGINLSLDGASSTGNDATCMQFYPSFTAAWLGKGNVALQDLTWLNRLDVRAEYGWSGNSRFASELSRYNYYAGAYSSISTIERQGVPNTSLKPERVNLFNVGLNAALLQNRLSFTVDYFRNRVTDMIMLQPTESVFGSSPYYANIGEMNNQGWEFSAEVVPVRIGGFEWKVGGNIALPVNEITSTGSNEPIITKGDDGMQLITVESEAPYQFYGWEMLGVFSTNEEAEKAYSIPSAPGEKQRTTYLTNSTGEPFKAGDVHYLDRNNDGKITDSDRVMLGTAQPDFFGGFYTELRYKGFALTADFNFAYGGKIYNAVRRQMESMKSFDNQSEAVNRRWRDQGDVTNVPQATYGDPLGNSAFSSRWLEDASYLRLQELTFSYSFDKTFLRFFRSGTLYVTGENLFTWTEYSGLSPMAAYGYGEAYQGLDLSKVQQPSSVKFGVNLKF
ncbi:MAG: SusC/RagA family TonB-linked outer membrane protein [Bacteroidaceae bacterium]|nr:SusC/RagA family TonB-linked outer membrane protein [Bacteroidaceae bacterium]